MKKQLEVKCTDGSMICVNGHVVELLMSLGYTEYPECMLKTVYQLLMSGF